MSAVLETLVALFIYGIPLFSMVIFLVMGIRDYGKPRRRRSTYRTPKRTYKRKFNVDVRRSEFRYADNESPGEYLVYFIENPKLNALKIGVGTAGRVLQLMNSFIDKDIESENIGWQVLRVGQFSFSFDDYDDGQTKALEAERRVKFYWKSKGFEPFLAKEQMGYSLIEKKDTQEILFVQTKGWSETVEMGKVCEVSSWNYVTSAPGFLGDSSEFAIGRDLLLLNPKDSKRTRPEGLKFPKSKSKNANLQNSKPEVPTSISREYTKRPKSDGTQFGEFYSRCSQSEGTECINWIGHITENGYGAMLWNGTPRPAHRVAWEIANKSELGDSFLVNKCGSRLCMNPLHWDKIDKSIFSCATPSCTEQSQTVVYQGLCEKCRQRAKVIRRAVREGKSGVCHTLTCNNVSASERTNSYCVECSAQLRI